MIALKILDERLADLERIFKMYQSTQVQMDINETKEAIDELEALQSRSCEGCKYFNKSINGGLCFRLDITVSTTFYCQGYEAKEQ